MRPRTWIGWEPVSLWSRISANRAASVLLAQGAARNMPPSAGPCEEDATPIRPVALYGRAKAAFWMPTEAYAPRYGFSAAWGRVFLPYGPRQPRRLVPSLLTALSAGTPIKVTDGSQVRDFVYASDVAELLVCLLTRSQAKGAYNVGTGRGTTVRQITERIADDSHAPGLDHFGARAGREGEPALLVADMQRSSGSLVGVLQPRSTAGWNDC